MDLEANRVEKIGSPPRLSGPMVQAFVRLRINCEDNGAFWRAGVRVVVMAIVDPPLTTLSFFVTRKRGRGFDRKKQRSDRVTVGTRELLVNLDLGAEP